MRNGKFLALVLAPLVLMWGCVPPQSPPGLGEFPLELIMPNATAVHAVVTGTPDDGSPPVSYSVDATNLGGGLWLFGKVKPGSYHIEGTFVDGGGLWAKTEYFALDVLMDSDGNITKKPGSGGGGSDEHHGQTSDGRLTIIVNGGVVNVNEQTVIGDNNSTQQGAGNIGVGGQGNTTGDNTTSENNSGGDNEGNGDGDDDPPVDPPQPPIDPPQPPVVIQPEGLEMVFEGKCDCQDTWVQLDFATATDPVIVRIRSDLLQAEWATEPVENTFPAGLTLQDFTPEVHLYVKKNTGGNDFTWEDLGKINLSPGQVEFTLLLPSDNKYWGGPYWGNFGLGGWWTRGTGEAATHYYVPSDFPTAGPTQFSVVK